MRHFIAAAFVARGEGEGRQIGKGAVEFKVCAVGVAAVKGEQERERQRRNMRLTNCLCTRSCTLYVAREMFK